MTAGRTISQVVAERPTSKQRDWWEELPGVRQATIAVVRGPKTPRIEAICSVAGVELRAEAPRQIPMMVPTVQLGAMMELPSRGSKETV